MVTNKQNHPSTKLQVGWWLKMTDFHNNNNNNNNNKNKNKNKNKNNNNNQKRKHRLQMIPRKQNGIWRTPPNSSAWSPFCWLTMSIVSGKNAQQFSEEGSIYTSFFVSVLMTFQLGNTENMSSLRRTSGFCGENSSCWKQWRIRRAPVEVGSWNPIVYRVSKTSQVVVLGFLNHQQQY